MFGKTHRRLCAVVLSLWDLESSRVLMEVKRTKLGKLQHPGYVFCWLYETVLGTKMVMTIKTNKKTLGVKGSDSIHCMLAV